MRHRFLVVGLVVGALAGVACSTPEGGSSANGGSSPEPQAAATDEASVPDEPEYDYTRVSAAKRGDLIKLPAYPDVAKFDGIADVRGMKTFEMNVTWKKDGIGPTFTPSVLIGSPGQRITLTGFRDTSGNAGYHSFTIDDIDLNKSWPVVKTTKVRVTFPEEGELGFYCSFHLEPRYWMAGLLRVGKR